MVVVCTVGLSGCSSKSTDPAPRSDLAAAPNLDVNTASSESYNCYGNGIGKQIKADPTGYKTGDSTNKTYEAVKKDLGGDKNVRKLDSIDSEVSEEYMMDSWDITKLNPIKERTMRRILILSIMVVILFSGCANNSQFKVGDKMSDINNENTPYISLNSLNAYERSSNYVIVISTEGVAEKLVEFSSERQSIRVQGLDLVKSQEINKYLNMDINKLKKELGQPHVDVGSGFYIPAYITNDAYLICFELEDDIVFEVIKRDLLTNDIITRVSN